jgi:integron integrase
MNGGVIAKLREVAKVRIGEREALCERTVETYAHWTRIFFRDTGKPASQWRDEDITRWMARLSDEGYAWKSRSQALCAIVYVFKNVLGVTIGELNLPKAPKQQATIKVIPTREELARIFAGLRGQPRLMAGVMYGAGLRVEECCMLRVKDVDFAARTIRVHDGKGGKDRLTLLPAALDPALRRQVAWRAALHDRDVAEGAGFVELPGRLAIKYPSAPRDLAWQFLFPSAVIREQRRWHAVPEGVQKAMRAAVKAAGLVKPVTPHTLRHAFATHALQAGNDISTVQQLLGHADVATTMIYLHGDRARGVSPLDVGAMLPAQPMRIGAMP